MEQKKELVFFETKDHAVKLEVPVNEESVWLNRQQMAELFDRDVKTIGKHINNAFLEELDKQVVVAKFATTTQHGAIENKTQTHMVEFYNLDVIISVGYRVKSKRGVEFRKWANSVLKQYILQGYAVNNHRIAQLGEVIKIMKRTEDSLDGKQILSVIEKYSDALDMLDSYDHQTMTRPKGNPATYTLDYEECMQVISQIRFGNESELPAVKRHGPRTCRGMFGDPYLFHLSIMQLEENCYSIFLSASPSGILRTRRVCTR